ncbi:hypothetical protein ZWY2020_030614 [Hordeum vulgare]|nr:hypothetical protein ZWY2020_030614 [Hordeum vulgare]
MTGRGGPAPGGPPALPASQGSSQRAVAATRGPSPACPASQSDPARPAPPAPPQGSPPDPAPAPRILLRGECSYAAPDGPPHAPSPEPSEDRRWEPRDPRMRDPSPVPGEPGRIQGRRVKSIIADASGAEVAISGPDPSWTEVARRGKRRTPTDPSVPRSLPAHQVNAVRRGSIRIDGACFNISPWHEHDLATFDSLLLHVRVVIEKVPMHLWSVEGAEEILGRRVRVDRLDTGPSARAHQDFCSLVWARRGGHPHAAHAGPVVEMEDSPAM